MNTQYNDPKGAAGALKTPLGLIPPSAMEQTALVHKLGAEKYGPFNWRDTGVCASTYINAILRHLNAWRDGENLDPESGISHLAHIACSCNILLDADYCGTMQDDRNTTPQNWPEKQEDDPDDLFDEIYDSFLENDEKYYALTEEDTIEEGDEYYDSYECGWIQSKYIGMPVKLSALSYRRPIEKSVDGVSECECGRYKIKHFIMGEICEDCELNWQDPY